MEVLQIPGYTEEEKVEIAKAHLVPRQREEHGLSEENIEFTEEAIRTTINDYTREAGVRNLDRELANLSRKIARRFVEGEHDKAVLDAERVHDLLGPVRHFRELTERTDRSGVAIGLAWTQVGGEILFVESSRMKGKGKITITGRLGDVMKESALAAMTWIRSNAPSLGIDEKLFEESDFHVHIPAGAIPKDGPSAGVTLTCSLVSLLTGVPVAPHLAMTGEVTLRGKVLPVGGVKEKVIAAKSAGIKRVLLPTKNEKDLVDVSQPIKDAMRFQFVDDIDQLLDLAFGEALREAVAASIARRSEEEPMADGSQITVVVTQDIAEGNIDAPTA
jgi:ATP-dependent Lon protease